MTRARYYFLACVKTRRHDSDPNQTHVFLEAALFVCFQEAIAYFPLVVLVAGVLASVGVKPLTKRFGSKVGYFITRRDC